jgi:DNA-binding XRE family transcriptional regulator
MQAIFSQLRRIDPTIRGEPDSIEDKQNWRKGLFMRPFCHLVFKAIRYDSPPLTGQQLAKRLVDCRLGLNLTRAELASKLHVSNRTLHNWERGRTFPIRKYWQEIRAFLRRKTV